MRAFASAGRLVAAGLMAATAPAAAAQANRPRAPPAPRRHPPRAAVAAAPAAGPARRCGECRTAPKTLAAAIEELGKLDFAVRTARPRPYAVLPPIRRCRR